MFLDFVNFYRKFITVYLKISVPLFNLLKGNAKNRIFIFLKEASKAFTLLKAAFILVLFLQHFNPIKLIYIKVNTSGFAIKDVLF